MLKNIYPWHAKKCKTEKNTNTISTSSSLLERFLKVEAETTTSVSFEGENKMYKNNKYIFSN